MTDKVTRIPTFYFDEKIGKLNAQFERLQLEGDHGVDQRETLREIVDLTKVIRLEAQKWIADRRESTEIVKLTRDDVVVMDMEREYHYDG